MRQIQTIEMMTRVQENSSLIGIVMSMALVLSLILFLEVSLISRISSPTRIYPKMEKEGIIDSFLKAGYQLSLIQIVALFVLLVLVTFPVVMLQQHIILLMFSVPTPVVMIVVLVIPVLVLLASLFRWFWLGRSGEG